MIQVIAFPDVEEAMRILVRSRYPELETGDDGIIHVAADAPGNLKDILPFCRTGRIGGVDDRITDRPIVDVDFFDLRYSVSRDRCRDFHAFLTSQWHTIVLPEDRGKVTFDRVETRLGPQRAPWADTNIKRFTSAYKISARR